MTAIYETAGSGVFAIDTEYVRPRMDASHLVVADGHAAFIDTGTQHSVPNLMSTLAALDIDAAAVDYIVLTHIHLDHAGGVGRLAQCLPRARVLVHPRGVAHIVDPSRLVAATQAVYGMERFRADYGEIVGVPAHRVDALDDAQHIVVGERVFESVHTPGHALHHLCIVDRDTGDTFAGDTFGVSYREFDTAAGAFIFPSTTPSQFDPIQLHASIERIVANKPRNVYLTHYSRVQNIDRLGEDLHADVDAFVRIAQRVADKEDPIGAMIPLLFEHLTARLEQHGFTGNDTQRHAVLDNDIALNAAGLHAWLARRSA